MGSASERVGREEDREEREGPGHKGIAGYCKKVDFYLVMECLES